MLEEMVSFNGVLYIRIAISKAPKKFPIYTISQFLSNCFNLISLFSTGIINRLLPVNNSVLNNMTRIRPIGKTNPDKILAML